MPRGRGGAGAGPIPAASESDAGLVRCSLLTQASRRVPPERGSPRLPTPPSGTTPTPCPLGTNHIQTLVGGGNIPGGQQARGGHGQRRSSGHQVPRQGSTAIL